MDFLITPSDLKLMALIMICQLVIWISSRERMIIIITTIGVVLNIMVLFEHRHFITSLL